MAVNKENKSVKAILLFFGILWAGLAVFVLPKLYGPWITPDEFGYWAHAASWAGFDWQEVTSLFSYYSFGYGVLIYPFFRWMQNPVVLYRTVAGVNFLLMWAGTLLLYRLLTKLLSQIERKQTALISGTAMLYVAYLTYVQMTLCEALLVFLYLLLAYAMYCWCRQPTAWNTLFVLLTAIYMYMVHMRTVSILLATALCMLSFLPCMDKKKKRILALFGFIFLGVAAAFVSVAMIQENWIQESGSERFQELAKINSYASKGSVFGKLLTFEGMKSLLASIAGKLFYLGCASFGVYFWGMYYLFKKVWQALKTVRGRQTLGAGEMLSGWLLLSHLSAFLITAVNNNHSGGRIDGVLYGRYHENTLPVILALGIYSLIKNPAFSKRMRTYVGIQSIAFMTVYYLLIQKGQFETLALHSITGIIYAAIWGNFYDNRLLILAFAGGILGCLILCGAGKAFGKSRRCLSVCIAVGVLQLILTGFSMRHVSLASVPGRREDSRVLCEAAELTTGQTGIYLMEGTEKLVCRAQFMLREPFRIIAFEEYIPEGNFYKENFLILKKGNEARLDEWIKEGYAEYLESPNYLIYYNPTVSE